MNDLPVFLVWGDFLGWILDHTEKFPKRIRFTISNRIDNLALDILENIIEAAYSRRERKVIVLRATNLKLEKLRVLLRISHDRTHLPTQSYEYAMREMEKAGNMIGGWIKERATVDEENVEEPKKVENDKEKGIPK